MELLNDLDISIRSWKRYPELLKNSRTRVFAFGVLLTLLFWIMTAAVPAAGFLARTGGYTKLVTQHVPEFTFSGGKLAVQGGFHYADGYRYFDVNTDPSNSVSLEDQKTRTQLALNSFALVADSEKMILKTDVALPGTEQGTRIVKFSDYANLTLTKADVLSFAPVFYGYIAMIGAVYFFMNLAAFFFAAAVIASFGRMFARLSGLRLDYGTIYRLTVYSRSVPVLLRGGLWLMGLMFAEYSALGFLYSIFVLTRVFRYIYEEGGDVLLKADRSRRNRDMYDPERMRGDQGMYNTDRQDPQSGERWPEDPRTEGEWPPREAGAADTGYRDARVPDISTVAKPVAGQDIKPSNGWSFGTREMPAQEAASSAMAGEEPAEAPASAAEPGEEPAKTGVPTAEAVEAPEEAPAAPENSQGNDPGDSRDNDL